MSSFIPDDQGHQSPLFKMLTPFFAMTFLFSFSISLPKLPNAVPVNSLSQPLSPSLSTNSPFSPPHLFPRTRVSRHSCSHPERLALTSTLRDVSNWAFDAYLAAGVRTAAFITYFRHNDYDSHQIVRRHFEHLAREAGLPTTEGRVTIACDYMSYYCPVDAYVRRVWTRTFGHLSTVYLVCASFSLPAFLLAPPSCIAPAENGMKSLLRIWKFANAQPQPRFPALHSAHHFGPFLAKAKSRS